MKDIMAPSGADGENGVSGAPQRGFRADGLVQNAAAGPAAGNDVNEAYSLAQRLRESERTLEYAVDLTGLWYWKYDPALDRAYLDAHNQRDFGLPPVMDNFMDRWLSMGFIHPDYKDAYRDAFRRAAQSGGDVINLEAKYFNREGAAHWARFRLSSYVDESSGHTVVLCTALPIDVEKELSAKYELEKKRPSLGENDLIAHALINLTTGETLEYSYADGSPVPVSDRTAMHYCTADMEALLIDESERRRFLELNNREALLRSYELGETEFKLDYRRRVPNGDVIWVRNLMHLVRDPVSGGTLLFEYYYNIEEEVTREQLYHKLISDNYEYVTRINGRNKHFVVLSRSSRAPGSFPLHGDDVDQVFKSIINTVTLPEDREIALRNTLVEGIRSNLEERERFQFTSRELMPDGSIRHKKITEYYLDRQRGIIAMTQEDVTPLIMEEAKKNRLMASALEAANQASRAKSRFLSRMSHELRTPMNAIIGLSALAAGEADNPAAMSDSIKKIDVSARYLLTLINDILEMSRIESGLLTLNEAPFDFTVLLDSVNTMILGQAKDKGVSYNHYISSLVEKDYIGDGTKLQQILINVLGNAVKFTPAGGAVTLSVERLSAEKDKTVLRFLARDNGVGIDQGFMDRLFDAFSQEEAANTSPANGTGLGLAITKNMIDIMDGSIDVSSEKGSGSLFTIDIPLRRTGSMARAPGAVTASSHCDFTGRRILLAEDHPLNIEVAKRLLERVGAEVVVARDGRQALDAFRNAPDHWFDAVLMDIRMPVMDGLTAARSIRGLKKDGSKTVPIIAMTANAFDEDVERSIAHGMNAHLIKPIEPRLLYSTLQKLMK